MERSKMKKQTITIPKFNEQEQSIIVSLQEERGITRKSAIRYFNKNRKELLKGFTPLNAGAQIPASTVDFKSQAANDDTHFDAGVGTATVAVPTPASKC